MSSAVKGNPQVAQTWSLEGKLRGGGKDHKCALSLSLFVQLLTIGPVSFSLAFPDDVVSSFGPFVYTLE